MSGFQEQWLTLREPYDAHARNADVLGAVAAAFAEQSMISVVDLACGTGSTFRTVSMHLPARQSWRLVDNDLSLLARAKPSALPAGVNVVTVPIDLNHDLEFALDGHIDLVVTSAFLDLVSAEWIERFTVECAARNLPVYAALSYDGRVSCEPPDSFDSEIVAAVNRHQMTDKGFGPALGPKAAADTIERLQRLEYKVVQGRSDWTFAARDKEIQTEIASGWAAAAQQAGKLKSADVAGWLARKRAAIAAGHSAMRVGHVDFFARPTGTR